MRRNKSIFYSKIALMVINFIAIVYNASIYLFATNYVVARGYAHSLLGRLDAIPGSPSFSFWMSIAFYACLLLVFYYRERHPNQLSVYDKVTIIEILLMLVIFAVLHSSYNGLILLVFADIFYGSKEFNTSKDRKYWFSFIILSFTMLLLSNYDLMSLFVKLPSLDTYIRFCPESIRMALLFGKNFLFSLNLVVFMISLLFYINRQKTKADGNTAILCRITIDGKNTAVTTGEECKPSEWNAKQGQTTNKKTNQRICEFRKLVERIYGDLLTRDGVVSVELIKNHLQGIATYPTTLLAMSKAELQSVKESVGKSRAEGTYLNLSYSDRNLREFIENKGVQDISITTITESLFEEYRFFLKKCGLKASTVNTNLCWLSRLMFRAVSKRIIRCNPFENTKYEKEEKKIRFLQKSDVMKLMAMKMNDKEAELARLMFVFPALSGND